MIAFRLFDLGYIWPIAIVLLSFDRDMLKSIIKYSKYSWLVVVLFRLLF